jgi:hypothetical protein
MLAAEEVVEEDFSDLLFCASLRQEVKRIAKNNINDVVIFEFILFWF